MLADIFLMQQMMFCCVQNGQTPLSIAQQLGYISVVEILKNVTTVTVATPTVDEKYKVVIPEMMQEAPIDSDEEGGELLHIIVISKDNRIRAYCRV